MYVTGLWFRQSFHNLCLLFHLADTWRIFPQKFIEKYLLRIQIEISFKVSYSYTKRKLELIDISKLYFRCLKVRTSLFLHRYISFEAFQMKNELIKHENCRLF